MIELVRTMKIDPYKNKERWLEWKKKTHQRILELTKSNSDIILHYLNDMENGLNVASSNKKGPRSYIRLNVLKTRLIFLGRGFEKRFKTNLIDLKEKQIHSFFLSMRNGQIKKRNGQGYISTKFYIKDFKSFWHWHIKVNRKQGKTICDITVDLDTSGSKPKWVYLKEEQVKKLCDNARYDYKILIMFLFDTGIRAPTELMNIKVSDISNNYKELHIRDEISKTFGRRIKLMLCSELLKEYIKDKGFKPDDYLFQINPGVVNRHLGRLAEKVIGKGESLAGELYSNLTMYDFRHCACCYWLPRYKSESALKYRFGWKKSDKIHYYSEMLGMKDTISEEDLLIDVTKTEIEKRLNKSEKDKEILQERMIMMEMQMKKILQMVNGMVVRVS